MYSYTIVWRPVTPDFVTPYAPAVIVLDEGYPMMTNLIGLDTGEVKVDMRVSVEFAALPGPDAALLPACVVTPPLHHLRVLEIATEIAGPYAGKLFADAGADVVKVESADGDPMRRSYRQRGSCPWVDSALVPVPEHVEAFGDRRPGDADVLRSRRPRPT